MMHIRTLLHFDYTTFFLKSKHFSFNFKFVLQVYTNYVKINNIMQAMIVTLNINIAKYFIVSIYCSNY